jgi:hypothetical protein
MEEERVEVGSIDEFLELVKKDEAVDQATVQTKMPINDYARARGIAPQRVHYHIRAKHLKKEQCICGRYVIDILAADQVFGFNQPHSLEVKYASDDNEED